jgi:hypothetical protein
MLTNFAFIYSNFASEVENLNVLLKLLQDDLQNHENMVSLGWAFTQKWAFK